MKQLFLSLTVTLFATFSCFSQTYEISEYNNQTLNICTGEIVLGDFETETLYTITVCSDDELEKHVGLYINAFSFPETTSMCIYDGDSDMNPEIECWNHTTDLDELAAQASNANQSGCITIVFMSSDVAADFAINVECEFVCEPRTVTIIDTDPHLTEEIYVDICWDELNNQSFPVTLTAEGSYPDAEYPLDDSNVIFRWDFQDGMTIIEGEGLNEITHNFTERGAYEIKLITIDSNGCETELPAYQKIRISIAPEWGVVSASETELCMGDVVEFCAYYSDTESFWEPEIVMGEEMPLPDGSGVCYENSIILSGFETDIVLEDLNDLNGICMNLVHSYIGDLTISLECPNGQSVQLQQQQGGGTDLGEPSLIIGTPGVGYWYCITLQPQKLWDR